MNLVKCMSPKHKYNNYSYRDFYEPSKPIPTSNGIQSKTNRGKFAQNWWADLFINVLESFGWTNRLQRGKRYARQGQVLEITIKNGQVLSKVQGSKKTPYKVTISLDQYSLTEWELIASKLSEEALISAILLTGEMPKTIDQKFTQLGFKLLPNSRAELKTNCSCPDSANPCKHIASVYYILGERFDDDPFLLFELRGIKKEQLLELLRKQRVADKVSDSTSIEHNEAELLKVKDIVGKNLSLDAVENYWGHKKDYTILIQDDVSPEVDIVQKLIVIQNEKNVEYTNEAQKILKEILKVMNN